MGTETDNDDFICFGIKYKEDTERLVPNIVEQFTSRIDASVNYIGDDAANQSPTYLQANAFYDEECGDITGETYVGGGVDQCWGIDAGNKDDSGFVPIQAWLFLPDQYGYVEEVSRRGYRWTAGEEIVVRVIPSNSATCGGNKETIVTLEDAYGLGVISMVALSSLLGTILF